MPKNKRFPATKLLQNCWRARIAETTGGRLPDENGTAAFIFETMMSFYFFGEGFCLLLKFVSLLCYPDRSPGYQDGVKVNPDGWKPYPGAGKMNPTGPKLNPDGSRSYPFSKKQ